MRCLYLYRKGCVIAVDLVLLPVPVQRRLTTDKKEKRFPLSWSKGL